MQSLHQRERRSVLITALIVCTFIVCWMPAWILYLVRRKYPSLLDFYVGIHTHIIDLVLYYMLSAFPGAPFLYYLNSIHDLSMKVPISSLVAEERGEPSNFLIPLAPQKFGLAKVLSSCLHAFALVT